jgi:glycosyltransferase involved in cell wall biosynthesis
MTTPSLRQDANGTPPSGQSFISPASFWVPDHFVLSAWTEHAPFAFWLVDVHRPRLLVELGTHSGFSYLVFAQAVKRLNLATRCFAIDTWKGDEHSGLYDDEVFAALRDYHDQHYSSFSQLVRTTFDEAVGHFEDESIDLLHIDGRHFYEDVKHDFDTWKPKLSNRAIVLLHDVEVQRRNFGVHKLWEELRGQYPHFEFVHGHGLGVLGVGPLLPDQPSALFAALRDLSLTLQIREMYGRLGGALQDRWLLKERTLQVDQSHAELAQKIAECEKLHSEMATKTAETRQARAQLSQSMTQQERLRVQVSQMAEQGQRLEAALVGREAELHGITSSASWRMTAMVRAFGNSLPSGTKRRFRSVIQLAWWTLTLQLRARLRQRSQLRRTKDLALESGLFDQEWYLTRNPDVAQAGVDPMEHYLLSGGFEGRDPSSLFDSKWYLTQNPDVAKAGMNPLIHYLGWGKAQGRLLRPSQARDRRPKIVFISGNQHAVGHRYRVLNLAESLAPQFYHTVIIPIEEFPQRLGEIKDCDIVWIWRTPYSEVVARVIETARHSGARVVFDIDDLLFRPELARSEIIDGIRSLGQKEDEARALYEGFRSVLSQADHFTTTTPALAREAQDLRKPTTVIPNGFEKQRLELSRAARLSRQAKASDGLVRIGYFGGTLTHQRDLAVASRSLAAVLAENPQVRLVLWRETVNLAEFPELERQSGQIEWRDRVARDNTPLEYATFDINIAPLEVGNPFCEAKSELKFFEAALLGMPTVASPTQPYADAIRHGESGFLANDDQQWYTLLRDLVQSPELRTRVGGRAYQEALWLYGPERRSQLMTDFVDRLLASGPPRSELKPSGASA